MIDKNSKEYKEGRRTRYFRAILLAILVVGGQIAFLISLSKL